MKNEEVKYHSTGIFPDNSMIPTIVFLFFFLLAFTWAIITGKHTNLSVMLFGEFFVIFLIIYLLRLQVKPSIVIGENYVKIPVFIKSQKKIRFDEIERIRLSVYESAKKENENFFNNVERISLEDKTGRKYNLYSLDYDKIRFVKDLKERMGAKRWKSKMIVDEWIPDCGYPCVKSKETK